MIYDPLTTDASGNRQPFPGNIIPANRINPWAREFLKAIPMPTRNVDDSGGNLPAQDVIKDKAQQGSIKIDHHFTGNIGLSGVYLYQNSSEPDRNFFPDAPYAYPSYQLDRAINVFVLNNTYIMNPSTVATLRFGMNTFDDDNSLPFPFDAHALGFDKAFVDAIPVQKFPSVTLTGYQGTGFTGVNNRNYYSYGGNGTVTRLAGGHSLKLGADYRIMGVKAENFGQSAGSLHVQWPVHRIERQQSAATSRNAIADLMLGYPSSGIVRPEHAGQQLDQLLQRLRAGRLARERSPDDELRRAVRARDGLSRSRQQAGRRLRPEGRQPAQRHDPGRVDPLNPTASRQVKGGLLYAGQNGAKQRDRQSAGGQGLAAVRRSPSA